MKDYYIIKLVWKDKEHFVIWYSDDKDGVVIYNGRVAVFDSIGECREFAVRLEFEIADESSNQYNFDVISNWVASPQSITIDPNHFINIWNLIDDISSSLNAETDPQVTEAEEKHLYEKLFWANNLPAVTPVDSKYTPNWSTEEVHSLAKIFATFLKLIESIMVD